MTGKVRVALGVLGAVMGVTLAAACGGGVEKRSSSGAIDESATLVVSHTIPPTSFDPHKALSDNDFVYLRALYDSLTDVDKAGGPVPMLAKIWELAKDGSTFTLVLREDATFSDGSPVDAAAVKANIDRLIQDDSLPASKQIAEIVRSVEVRNTHTAVLHLKGAGGSLPLILAGRPGMLVAPKAIGKPDLDQKPVGAGAMEMSASTPGSSYEYTRRQDYWDANAYRLARLKAVVQPDASQALNALRSGQASLMSGTTEALTKEAKAAGMRVESPDGEPVDHFRLTLNTKHNALGKRQVRQAISSAINRDAINKGLYGGMCPARVNPFPSAYFAHGAKGNDAEWGYNPERAKRLLAEAGLVNGLSFELGSANAGSQAALAQVIQEDLKKVGITTKIVALDPVQLRARFASGDLDTSLGLTLGPTDPSSYYADYIAPQGVGNPGRLSSDKVEQLEAATRVSADTSERAKAYEPLMNALFDMGPSAVPVCGWERAYILRPEVSGVAFRVTGAASLRAVTLSR